MKRIVGAGALLLVLSALVAGCGDEAATETGAGGSGPTATAATPSPSVQEEPVAPATGPELSIEGLSLRVPEGWQEVAPVVELPNTADAESPDLASSISITAPPFEVGEEMDHALLESNMERAGFEVLEPVEVAGHEFARGLRRDGDGLATVRVVSVLDGYQTAVSFYFERGVPTEEREAVTASVLSTVELG